MSVPEKHQNCNNNQIRNQVLQTTTPKLKQQQKQQEHHKESNTNIGTMRKIAIALHNTKIKTMTKTTGALHKQQHQN